MNQSQRAFEKLFAHEFGKLGLNNAVEMDLALRSGSIVKAEAQYMRELDEYEFYVLEVGSSIAQLYGLCEQLVHAVLYLSAFSPSKRMKEGGITRASHVGFSIENFLIRTQSLNDRILKLVNAVFHLGLAPRDCRHETIAKNAHVATTDVPTKLNSLRRLVSEYGQERNQILHHAGFTEDDLRRLEMLYLVQKTDLDSVDVDVKTFLLFAQNRTREYVGQKTEEFDTFLESVFQQLESLLDDLATQYTHMTNLLTLKLRYSARKK